jgi:hypothetical protein
MKQFNDCRHGLFAASPFVAARKDFSKVFQFQTQRDQTENEFICLGLEAENYERFPLKIKLNPATLAKKTAQNLGREKPGTDSMKLHLCR